MSSLVTSRLFSHFFSLFPPQKPLHACAVVRQRLAFVPPVEERCPAQAVPAVTASLIVRCRRAQHFPDTGLVPQ